MQTGLNLQPFREGPEGEGSQDPAECSLPSLSLAMKGTKNSAASPPQRCGEGSYFKIWESPPYSNHLRVPLGHAVTQALQDSS